MVYSSKKSVMDLYLIFTIRRWFKRFTCVTSKSRRIFVKWKEWEGESMEKRIQKLCFAGTQRHVLLSERTFMALEYESTSRKAAIMSFSKSNAIIDPNFESRNLILFLGTGPRAIFEGKGRRRSLDLIIKGKNDFR